MAHGSASLCTQRAPSPPSDCSICQLHITSHREDNPKATNRDKSSIWLNDSAGVRLSTRITPILPLARSISRTHTHHCGAPLLLSPASAIKSSIIADLIQPAGRRNGYRDVGPSCRSRFVPQYLLLGLLWDQPSSLLRSACTIVSQSLCLSHAYAQCYEIMIGWWCLVCL
jgi:hypothetical protein